MPRLRWCADALRSPAMRGRRTGSRFGVLAAVQLALFTLLAGCSLLTPQTPAPPTQAVAGETDAPQPTATPAPPTPQASVGATLPPPSLDPGVTEPPPGIVPGTVGKSTFRVTATYDVNAVITVATGALEMATLIQVRNDSGFDIDRIELNTVAAAVGNLRVTRAAVDDTPVKTRIQGQTIVVPLGGILRAGASTTIRIESRSHLTNDHSGLGWMFTMAGGTLALHRWIPWVSRAVPTDRPDHGEPFVTPTSPQVDVEIVADQRLVLASPAKAVVQVPAGGGRAWAFTMNDVRDVSVVLAPDFQVLRGTAAGVPIHVYSRSGAFAGQRLMDLARQAVRESADLLGVEYPYPVLSVVETLGGDALETPGLVWMPRTADETNRTYLVHHEVAQQWFYGLVGSDQYAQPFADEAPADLVARLVLGNQRASRCPIESLDRSLPRYSEPCYYEVIFVQGGLLLDEIRGRMGNGRFWEAIRGYLEANRYGLGGTKALLEALREGTDVNLMPLLRARFPTLY